MNRELVKELMLAFANSSGVTGNASPRRYLWTDAFAVRNFLDLTAMTGDDDYRGLAVQLVDQVHHVLGQHRPDDPRRGWISGLPVEEGERHPTCGGLRIGKKLPERRADETPDPQLEWERDGQYFHYLTRWMQALYQTGRATASRRYLTWARELAVTAHQAFTYEPAPRAGKRMFWKMSIDLSRPLVESMGHHDPLDGLITCLELRSGSRIERDEDEKEESESEPESELSPAIEDFDAMCAQGHWATDDPLGIGGLLDNAVRLWPLVTERGVERRDLLVRLLREAKVSLRAFKRSSLLNQPAEYRLAFRELGLAIGLHDLEKLGPPPAREAELACLLDDLRPFAGTAERIDRFWSDAEHRGAVTWTEHQDINDVMLATSLAAHGASG